jgi:hypothetical protein
MLQVSLQVSIDLFLLPSFRKFEDGLIYSSFQVWFMVFNATFNNISIISWWSVLLVEETGVSAENHRPVASHCHWRTSKKWYEQIKFDVHTEKWTYFIVRKVWRVSSQLLHTSLYGGHIQYKFDWNIP